MGWSCCMIKNNASESCPSRILKGDIPLLLFAAAAPQRSSRMKNRHHIYYYMVAIFNEEPKPYVLINFSCFPAHHLLSYYTRVAAVCWTIWNLLYGIWCKVTFKLNYHKLTTHALTRAYIYSLSFNLQLLQWQSSTDDIICI